MSSTSSISSHLAVAILAVTLGYWTGVGRTLFPSSAPSSSSTSSHSPTTNPSEKRNEDLIESSSSEDEDDDDEEPQQEGLDLLKPISGEEIKMVLCVRSDLGMTKGKIGAQCGHAAVGNYMSLSRSNAPMIQAWLNCGQPKIALKVDSEEELDTLQAIAVSIGLCARVIRDAGRTQIASGSKTVLAIGPGSKSLINQVTGHLKLL